MYIFNSEHQRKPKNHRDYSIHIEREFCLGLVLADNLAALEIIRQSPGNDL